MEFSDIENCSNFTNKTCFEFSENHFWVIVWLRTGLSILGAVLSFVAIVGFLRRKFYKKDVLEHKGRLGLYLCIASLVNGIVTAIQIVPVRRGPICGHVVARQSCAAVSALITYSVWTVLVLMVWIYVEIIIAIIKAISKAVRTELGQVPDNERCCMKCINKYSKNYKCYDGWVWLTALLFPIIPCIIPLTKPKLYGLSGAWCWIKARDEDCQEIKAGVYEQFFLWYAMAMAFITVYVVTTLLAISVVVVMICYKYIRKDRDDIKLLYRRYVKDILPLFVCPFIFSVIYGFGFANRIYYVHHSKAYFWLFIVIGITDAAVSLAISSYFLVYHFYFWCCKKESQEAQPLIPPGGRERINFEN